MTENPELLKTIEFMSIPFQTSREALRAYVTLDEKTKQGMVTCYREFEKPPWNDDPYDPDKLINFDFPKMLTSFTPGGLVIAKNMQGDVIGFAAGGQTTLMDLVISKYDKATADQQLLIADSIQRQTGLRDSDEFMYENELVVTGLDEYRNQGIGTRLSSDRQQIFEQFGYGAILGRSLNPYLLMMKDALFSNKNGFSLTKFIPDGDPYVNPITGTKRTIYFAAKIR